MTDDDARGVTSIVAGDDASLASRGRRLVFAEYAQGRRLEVVELAVVDGPDEREHRASAKESASGTSTYRMVICGRLGADGISETGDALHLAVDRDHDQE